MPDFEMDFLFDSEVDEEKIEHGSEIIFSGIVPHISHQTGEFDPSGYTAGYQKTREQLLKEGAFTFTERDFEICLMRATGLAETYVRQLREASIEEQFYG